MLIIVYVLSVRSATFMVLFCTSAGSLLTLYKTNIKSKSRSSTQTYLSTKSDTKETYTCPRYLIITLCHSCFFLYCLYCFGHSIRY